jgi:mRNA interferase RelE/StbE
VKILYAKAFGRDLEAISRNTNAKKKLLGLIEELKSIDSLHHLHDVRKIEGYESYYRLRVGDYRLGVKVSGTTIELIRFLHRKEIYRRFP